MLCVNAIEDYQGANRTNVGLKPGSVAGVTLIVTGANRTNVGLKRGCHFGSFAVFRSANRTNVGLKRGVIDNASWKKDTVLIEPTWD